MNTPCFLLRVAQLTRAAGEAADRRNAVRSAAVCRSRCVACHAIDDNGVGPAHRGVFGSSAGSRPDDADSDAARSCAVLWTEKTLAHWPASPEDLIPGRKMGGAVASPADLIAYLKAHSHVARGTSNAAPPPTH